MTGDSVSREAVLRAIEVHTLGQPWSVVRNLRTRIRALPAVEPDPEMVNAKRDSLAQEIRETLTTRGHWAPSASRPASDLIGALARALETKPDPVREAAVALAEAAMRCADHGEQAPLRSAPHGAYQRWQRDGERLDAAQWEALRAYRAAKEAADAE